MAKTILGTAQVTPATVTSQRLLGRYTAGNGATEEIVIGTGLSLTGSTLSSTSAPSPDSRFTTDILTADQSNSTVTPTKVTGLDQTLAVGTYQFKYMIRYLSATQTVGVRFSVNFSGTTVFFLANMRWVDASATASTAAPDQNAVLTTGSVVGAMAAREKSTAGWGTTISVDTINLDMLMIIEGTFQCSTSGDIQLYHGSETATSTTIKAGSSLVITKVS